MVFTCGSKCKCEGVLRSPHAVPSKWMFQGWAVECEEWQKGLLVCCTRMWVFLNFLTRDTHRVKPSSFPQYQMLWIDQNDKANFFNICSCLFANCILSADAQH